MDFLDSSSILFYGGLALAGLAAAGGIFAAVLFHVLRARLRKRLEEEYGKPMR